MEIKMTNTNTTATGEKLYKRYDIQDESDYSIETLAEMRQWLADFWDNNPDDDMDEEEHNEMIEAILNADEKEIFERLGGVDYSYYELDETGVDIVPEVEAIETNMSWGFSVKSEKISDTEVAVTIVRRGELMVAIESSFIGKADNWELRHDAYADMLMVEVQNYRKK